jgi:anti-sigma-K factor RskA
MSPDLHTLTGAYAMHALPDDERAVFEEHLRQCDACAQEVAELIATAARLGAAQVAAPPAGMRDAVLGRIAEVRQEAPVPATNDAEVVELSSRRRWVDRLLAPAAGVAAIAVVALSVVVANLNDRLEQVESTSSAMAELVGAPDARMADLTGEGGEFARVVMAESRGEAMFVVDGMAPAPEDQIYALWLIHRDEAVTPAGVVEIADDGSAARMVTGELGEVVAIGVTAEPAGTPLDEPTSDPLMVLEVDDA